jgi:hypothetical protein
LKSHSLFANFFNKTNSTTITSFFCTQLSMANGKRATARKSASARNTGVRKTRKKNDENIPAAAAPPRPKPRPRVKKAAAGDIGDAVTSADKDDAAAATILISMAAPRGGEIDASNVDDDLQLIDASKDCSVEESDLEVASDEEPDFSEEDQEASDEGKYEV